MTGNNLLLDTNIIIEVFDGNRNIADKIDKLPSFYISSVVLGELYIGVNRVVNKEKHLRKLQAFLQLCFILNADSTTAWNYGKIVATLYKKGKPLPTNDIWIAAVAQQYNLTVITRDKHFREIENLEIENW